jgi:hypothetical protein
VEFYLLTSMWGTRVHRCANRQFTSCNHRNYVCRDRHLVSREWKGARSEWTACSSRGDRFGRTKSSALVGRAKSSTFREPTKDVVISPDGGVAYSLNEPTRFSSAITFRTADISVASRIFCRRGAGHQLATSDSRDAIFKYVVW